MKVKELLSDESKWTQCKGARGLNGLEQRYDSKEAVCWCLLGAIAKCYKKQSETSKITILVQKEVGSVFAWNDNTKRTFAEVKALVERLDI